MDIKKGWTGERLETFISNESTTAHLHRYAMAIQLVNGKNVLDIACGEGYGTRLLANICDRITGVDIDEETVEKAKNKYIANNIEFLVGSADNIPAATGSIDVVVSFETLEHHDKHHEMMQEIVRVLKPDGILIISSPDKKNYSDAINYKNPFHVKELYAEEFRELVGQYFQYNSFYGQALFKGSLIMAEDASLKFKNFGGGFEKINTEAGYEATYLIAIAGKQPLKFETYNSIFSSDSINRAIIENLAAEKRAEGITFIKNSFPYRIGSTVLWPLKMLQKIIGK